MSYTWTTAYNKYNINYVIKCRKSNEKLNCIVVGGISSMVWVTNTIFDARSSIFVFLLLISFCFVCASCVWH